MATKADLLAGAFRGGIETTVPECAAAFGCLSDDPLLTAEALKVELEASGLQLAGGGEFAAIRVLTGKPAFDISTELSEGEHSRLEFKETLLLNVRQAENQPTTPANQLDQEVTIQTVLKTICGFLNRDGGVLYIGVTATGEVTGIEKDFRCFTGAGDADRWQLRLSALIRERFKDGLGVLNYVDIRLEAIGNVTVCRLNVTARQQESFIRDREGKSHFYVRSGSETNELHIEEIPEFVRLRIGGSPR